MKSLDGQRRPFVPMYILRMKKESGVVLLLALGLAVSAYTSGPCGRRGGACLPLLPLGLIGAGSGIQKVANTEQKKEAAPAWTLKGLDGKEVKLSDFKGKTVLLNFWATWCPPCRNEIPTLIALQKEHAGKGLVVIGVSMVQQGPDVVKPFVNRMKMEYPIVMGSMETAIAYGGVQYLPTTFLIDREGNVASIYQGDTERAVFEADLKKVL